MVIPADWKEVRLGEICELSLATSKKSRSDGRGKYIIADMGSVSKDGSFLTHKTTDVRDDVLRTGDLVMPKDDIGGGQIIGKAVLVDEDERYVLGDHVYRLRLSDGFPAFVRYGINSYKVNIQLRSKVVGSAQLGLGRRAVLEQPISFPPLKEQEAIADALSDADVAIESLDALVAKKRDVKQATMQQLLAGRTRLPGFTADWKEVRLGEICELSLATSKKSRSDGRGKYIIADMGSVSKDGSFLTHKTTDVRDDVLRTGDLVMPKDDIGGGQIIGKAVLVDEDERYVLGDHVYRLRLSDGFPAFVRYGINSYKVNIQLRSKVVGSAQLGLGRRAVLEQPISFPPLKEQEAIAEALSVMDEELEALAEQVSKMRMVKEGMMQDLLSGKVRLV